MGGAEEAASRTNSGRAGAAEGAVGSGKAIDFELDQGFGANGELEAAIAAVNQSTSGDDASAFFFDHADGFVGGATGGPNIFDHENAFAGFKVEAAAKSKVAAGVTFNKDGTSLRPVGTRGQCTGDFVADNQPAQSRGDDAVDLQVVKLSGQRAAKLLGMEGMLEDEGALNVGGTVQAGGELEMAVPYGADRF